jgi:hypothetical protein
MYHNFVGSDLWGDIHGSNYRQTQVIKHHRHTQINKAAVTLSNPQPGFGIQLTLEPRFHHALDSASPGSRAKCRCGP